MEFSKPEIIATLGVLSSVIVGMWLIIKEHSKREMTRLEKYENAHGKSQDRVIELTGEFHELKGRIDGIEALSKTVLKTIEDRIK